MSKSSTQACRQRQNCEDSVKGRSMFVAHCSSEELKGKKEGRTIIPNDCFFGSNCQAHISKGFIFILLECEEPSKFLLQEKMLMSHLSLNANMVWFKRAMDYSEHIKRFHFSTNSSLTIPFASLPTLDSSPCSRFP